MTLRNGKISCKSRCSVLLSSNGQTMDGTHEYIYIYIYINIHKLKNKDSRFSVTQSYREILQIQDEAECVYTKTIIFFNLGE